MEPLSNEVRAGLMQELTRGSVAYLRNLAAVEQAVQRGQFNVAKVLRTAAYSQRTIAFNAARILEQDAAYDPSDLLTTILREQHSIIEFTSETLPAGHAKAREMLQRSQVAQERIAKLTQRSLDSLAAYPDILERDVPMIIASCLVCGNLIEEDNPRQCDLCGAILPEFQFLGPFYAATPEILGRLSPEEVIATLVPGPAQMEALILDVDDELLRRKPSEPEWSIKVIVAHILETDYMCVDLVQSVLAKKEYPGTVEPWATHIGKGYEDYSAARLCEQLTAARAKTLALLRSLAPDDWAKSYRAWGHMRSILHFGVWHANHDVGHLAQIKRLLKMWQVIPAG
jgi:rubrerythrin